VAGKQRFSQGQVITALTEARGLVSHAAARLGCDADTVANYARRYPAVRAARDAARAHELDRAEGRLFDAVDAGEPWAVTFVLTRLGRGRGYGDRLEVAGRVDLLASPEWLQTRALLLEVLGHFPEARMAVVTRLRALRAPRGEDDDAG